MTTKKPLMRVRLYENPRFGSQNGAKSRNHLVLNGSLELGDRKVFVDLATLDHLAQSVSAAAAHLHVVIENLAKKSPWSGDKADVLAGQLKLVDPYVDLDGAVVANLRNRQLLIFLSGPDGLVLNEQLVLRPCAKPKDGQKSPAFYATNESEVGPTIFPDAAAQAKAASMLEAIRNA